MKALVGYTGFVGSHLLKWQKFDSLYNSTNFHEAKGSEFDLVVFSGCKAEKWKANQDPAEDLAHVKDLVATLETIRASKFVLISTIDVYPSTTDDQFERWIESDEENHAYGKHRAQLENFAQSHFQESAIVRLPALFGAGLKKNAIFDFLTNNNTEKIDSRGLFEFYSLEWLAHDIERVLQHNIRLLNITSEPITIQELVQHCFDIEFENHISKNPASYRVRSKYGRIWGSDSGYLYSRAEVLSTLRGFVQRWKTERLGQ